MQALCGEIDLFKKLNGEAGPVRTVYIGGGTPSLLSPVQLKTILDKIKSEFILLNHENTIEANPEDITPEKADCWKINGINRVSLGFQSMEEKILKFLERKNTAVSNIRAFNFLRDAGIKNISIDLIACIRGEIIHKTLDAILTLKPPHISVYQLSIENKTRLSIDAGNGNYVPSSDMTCLRHYREICRILRDAGYIQYEISNFALEEKYFCSHNMNYWDYGEYIGFGAGASGCIKGNRWTNTSSLKNYSAFIDRRILPRDFTEKIDRETAIREFIMLGLRKTGGISGDYFEELFKTDLEKILISRIPSGLDPFLQKNGNSLSLTERGFEVSNRIITELWNLIS